MRDATVQRVSPIELNTNVPHSARIYDYLLGGKELGL
ncbi:SAM-dependent methyltransferase [Actinoplanes subtropicus]|nr:SAM-dependent methyltransferase [Actinoplanes subtropicus]